MNCIKMKLLTCKFQFPEHIIRCKLVEMKEAMKRYIHLPHFIQGVPIKMGIERRLEYRL